MTEYLGDVVLLAPEGNEVEHRIGDGAGRPREPERAGVIGSDLGVPCYADVSQFTPSQDSPVQIDTPPEFIDTSRCGRAPRLPAPERGSDWPPPDGRVVQNEVSESQNSFPDDDWDFDEIEERLAIMTIDGELTEEEARAALGLSPTLPSFYDTVDRVTGGHYPTEEDRLEAMRRWIEDCRCGGHIGVR